jgi:small conductance mechanosensitive channel
MAGETIVAPVESLTFFDKILNSLTAKSSTLSATEQITMNIICAALIFFVGLAVIKIILSIARKILSKTHIDEIIVNFLLSIARAALLLLVFIAVLKQLGFDTNSLVALIGAAGLAIGLALQSSLQNFAAGFMLIVFKPFKDGDFVELANTSGVVEKINIFSTTLRSADNKEITVSNGAIYGNTIVNYSARDTRRIDMVVGISYESDLKKAKELLVYIINQDARILKDPAPEVSVSELADSSVNFVVRPWVSNSDYWNVKCALTENIKLTFDANGIVIPFPQMQVHLKKLD